MQPHASTTLAIYGFTLFLSAAIMFALQPMAGKMLLPLVGGSPAGWIVAMAFFQIMLLAGYLLAHAFSSASPRVHGILYLLGLAAGCWFLPISLDGHAPAETPGAWGVFMLLTVTVAVPFIALSATSSTIQRLFTRTTHGSAHDPYFLYAASNLGSFAGLLLYPAVMETLMDLDRQAEWMRYGYFALLGAGALCLLLARGRDATQEAVAAPAAPPGWNMKLRWLALSFVPSSLLMGVTTYITTDIISAPMLWILPLGAYLLTFVIAFGKYSPAWQKKAEFLHPYAVCIAIFLISVFQSVVWLTSPAGVLFCVALFAVAAVNCHMQLALLRPASRYLTSFYLMISIGGALGGALNAFVIPFAFNRLIEFPLMLIISLLLHSEFRARSRAGMATLFLLGLSLLLVNAPPLPVDFDTVAARKVFIVIFMAGLGCLIPAYGEKIIKPAALTLIALVVFMINAFAFADTDEVMRKRNFYGAVTVLDRRMEIDGKEFIARYMRHGTTIHGLQVRDPSLMTAPTSYYSPKGPVGDIFAATSPKKVAVLGLGTGASMCHRAPGRGFTFIEIDPEVERIARAYFTFLADCAEEEKPRVLIGDGRLKFAELEEKFDLILVDVFTSDSIPTHLITREALEMYFERLRPGGIVAVNISNRYFEFWDILAATGAAAGLETRARFDLNREMLPYEISSIWAALSRKGEMPVKLAQDAEWRIIEPAADLRPWTDNYTNILGIMLRKPSGNMGIR